MRVRPPSVFRRYLVSFLVLFLVPFASLTVLLYGTTVRRLREQIESSASAALRQALGTLERRFDDIDSVAARITIDPRLTPYWIRNPGYARIEAVRELASYVSRGGFVDEIIMLVHESPAVLLSSGAVSRDSFLDTVYRYEGFPRGELAELLGSATRPVLIPAHTVSARASDSGSGRFLTYVYPIPPRNLHPYGSLLFLIEEDRVIELVREAVPYSDAIAAVLDREGSVVASSLPDGEGRRTLSRELGGHARLEGLSTATIHGTKRSLVAAYSPSLELLMLSAVPRSHFLRGVVQARIIVILSLALLGGLGVWSAYALARRSYEPVRRLVNLATASEAAGQAEKLDDEFDRIRKALQDESASRRELLLKIELQKPLVRERYLARLIAGQSAPDADMAALAREAGVDFPYPGFFAVVVRLPKGGRRPVWDRELTLHLIREFSTSELRAYGLELAGEGEVALVVNASASAPEGAPSARPVQERVTADIRRLLDLQGGEGASIGVGRLYGEARSIAASFLEASSALEQRAPTSRGYVSFFEDIGVASGPRYWYPLDEELLLVQSIKQGNHVLATRTIARIAERIRNEDRSVFLSRIICFDLLNTVVKTVKDLRPDGFEPHVDAAVRFATLEELTRNLSRLVRVACEHVKAVRGTRHDRLRDAILAYVRDNFRSRSFCLEELAVRFGLSLSHLSRFFKEQTGTRFSEYVNQVRMEEVKGKLRETELSVRQIVESIGYGDAANFIRKFRKREGVTPGVYRDLHRRRDESPVAARRPGAPT